jgi:hypothetical protein
VRKSPLGGWPQPPPARCKLKTGCCVCVCPAPRAGFCRKEVPAKKGNGAGPVSELREETFRARPLLFRAGSGPRACSGSRARTHKHTPARAGNTHTAQAHARTPTGPTAGGRQETSAQRVASCVCCFARGVCVRATRGSYVALQAMGLAVLVCRQERGATPEMVVCVCSWWCVG